MSLAATLLSTGFAKAGEKFKSFEDRSPDNGMINAFLKYATDVVPQSEIDRLKTSTRRPTSIPVLNKLAGTVGTVRSINPTPDIVTSALAPTNWITRTFSFAVSEAINADNLVGFSETFAHTLYHELLSVYFGSANSLEKYLAAFLETNKHTSLPTSKVKGVTSGAGAYSLDTVDYLIKTPVIMRELQMNGTFQDISNVATLAGRRADLTYGANNNQNLSQFIGNLEFSYSNNLDVTEDMDETHYVCPKGSLALLNFTEFDARNSTKHDNGFFELVKDPLFGFNWGVRVTSVPTDLSNPYGAGMERAVQTRFDFAADFAAVRSYSSVSAQSPIVKFDTVTA